MNLENLRTKQQLKQLIVEELGYSAVADQVISLNNIDEDTRSRIASATTIAVHNGFNIVFIQFNSINDEYNERYVLRMRGAERTIISKISKHLLQQHLFVFASSDGQYWHFVNARSSGNKLELRRFSITPFNRGKLRTASSRLALLKTDSGDNLQVLIEKNRKAFDVEEVTMEFFQIFAGKFLDLIDIIKKAQVKEYSFDPKTRKNTAQIILNRVVFLKFIEQKKWLDNEPNYLYEKFQPYFNEDGSYWKEVLLPLFDLLSNPERNKVSELGEIPFLNGGLFGSEPKNLSQVSIPNDFFQDLFENLLNRFNFTIEEAAPNSVEVAVDPEMLGRIFEELVLRLEKTAEKSEADFNRELRRETGSYYTPRVAVFFMCREAISRRLSDITKINIGKVKKIIDLSLDEVSDEEQINKINLSMSESQGLLRATENISICDPAVGSGAFPLGVLQMLTGLRRFLMLKIGDKRIKTKNFDYFLKTEIIKNNLVGVDLMLQAVNICELRLWLSLAVDYDREEGEPIPPLPNLTFKVFWGDSVADHLYGEQIDGFRNVKDFSSNQAIRQNLSKIVDLKNIYFSETKESGKRKLERLIAEARLKLAIDILTLEAPQISTKDLFGEEKIQNDPEIEKLLKYLNKALSSRRFDVKLNDKLSFVWAIDLVEYLIDHHHGGFDIVIGNPPYGVKNEIMKKGKERYTLGSKDSYGIFIAMAFQDLLKPDGILSFITSDTWQTIKSHRPLRRMLLDNSKIHNLILMPPWLFGATVNTSILIATKSERGRILHKQCERVLFKNSTKREESELIVCDLTRAQDKTGELEEYLYSLDNPEYVSTSKKAFYHYQQGLIETNSNWPFFVGSPKLFALMNDTTCKTIEKEIGEEEKKKVKVRQIYLNRKLIEQVRLGDIADIRQGLATGDNDSYLFQNADARGNYRSISAYSEFLLTEEDLTKIRSDEKIRIRIIEKGIHKSKTEKLFDSDLWFRGRYISPYDKGGAGDTEKGFLPNYYIPIDYFIDWSQKSVKRMKTLTIGERDGTSRNQRVAVIRSPEFYFKEAITFSFAGQYSPTFRIGSSGPFDHASSNIFCTEYDNLFQLGILASKLQKFFARVFINHTVNYGVDDLKENPFNIINNKSIIGFIDTVITKQRQNPHYDYMSNEQKEIDKIVYKMYGLDKDDIREVETWYARRYPKLARFCDIN